MESSFEFLKRVLDSITEHIVVIDETGEILFVNRGWSNFGITNACAINVDWTGVNYLAECDKASAMGDAFGSQAGDGIRSVIDQSNPSFYFEYPCHSPVEKRWFMMHVTSFTADQKRYFVISHQNITQRKLAEEAVANLARIDGLTDIPNRRAFDDFFQEEWRRCARLKKPISLAIVDLDYFKLINDSYGHQSGDECLKQVSELLKGFAQRPSDFCARYGGEEFVLVLGDTSISQAKELTGLLIQKITELKIVNLESPTEKYLTASIGLAEDMPSRDKEASDLINRADQMLYRAKSNGRNRVEC